MQKINLHNYEAFLLDYMEGNLNKTDLQELKNFALLHPELDIDLSIDPLPTFNSENEIFEYKSELLKTDEDVYNVIVLNYIEGNLSEKEKTDFDLQLSLNPELKREVEAYKKTDLKIITEDLKFNSTHLFKTEDDFVLNNPSLHYIENTLSTSDKINFENELKTNKTLQKEITQFQKTKLSADISLIYPNKEELKKESKVIALFNFRTVSAIAAGLLLIVSLSILLNNYTNSNEKVEGKIALNIKNINNFSILQKQTTNAVITSSVLNNSSSSLIAKNSSYPNHSQKDSTKTNSIYPNNNSIKNIAVNNSVIKDTVNSTTNNLVAISSNSSIAITYTNTFAAVNTQTTLLAYEEDLDETSPENTTPQKNNFWKRAVKVAKQLNGLGLKAVKGDEKSNSNYILAFNSMSIEKK